MRIIMYKKGDKVKAEITNITSFGAFCKLPNATGLIHISEFSDYFVKAITDYVTVGDKVDVEVLDYDDVKKQAKLSYKSIRPELLKLKDHQIQENKRGFENLQSKKISVGVE